MGIEAHNATHTQQMRAGPFFFKKKCMPFDEGAAQTAELILMCDTSINTVWQDLDPFREIKNSSQ